LLESPADDRQVKSPEMARSKIYSSNANLRSREEPAEQLNEDIVERTEPNRYRPIRSPYKGSIQEEEYPTGEAQVFRRNMPLDR